MPHERSLPHKYLGSWVDTYGGIFIRFEAGLNASVSDNVMAYDVYTPGTEPIIAVPLIAAPLIAVPLIGILNTAAALNVGILREGTHIILTEDIDSISHEPFQDGDACIQILNPAGNVPSLNPAGKCFVYHAESLQGWFNLGNKEEPRTRLLLSQADLKRFIYHA
jgi:hypothetical protein